jgi:hypothetical protein
METEMVILAKHPEIRSDVKNSIQIQKQAKTLAISYFITGLFAAIGALYRWGDGPLFLAQQGDDIELFIAELVVAAPASILASIGLVKLQRWGMIMSLFSTGVFIYGSALVYASIFIFGAPIPLKLLIPPIFGIGLSIATIWWIRLNGDERLKKV